MIIEFRCAPANRHGMTARLDIRDVAAADAPIAIRCTHRCHSDETVTLRWWDGRLWASPRPGFRDTLIQDTRQALKRQEADRYRRKTSAEIVAELTGILERTSASLIAVNGVIYQEENEEPYWKYGSDHQSKFGLRLAWARPDLLASTRSVIRNCFRADQLEAARAFLRHDHKDGVRVFGACEVLMPEILRHDPERLWWKDAFLGVRQGITGAMSGAPPRPLDEIVDAIGDAIRTGIDELAAKNGLSRHHVMRIFARINAPRDHSA